MRVLRHTAIFGIAGLLFVGCEDGPAQIHSEFKGDRQAQNGLNDTPSWNQDGDKQFETANADEDKTGTGRHCSLNEKDALIQKLVVAPLIPDKSAGGIPLWGEGETPLHADSLLGNPADGAFFCQPDGIYTNAYTWGPTNEIIVFFNEETRLVEGIGLTLQYRGWLEATTKIGGTDLAVRMSPSERIRLGGKELDQYASRADQAAKPNSFLNTQNITKIYSAVRETFFGESPVAASYDCVTDLRCDVIYTDADESRAQDTVVVMRDSGLQIGFTPDGFVDFLYLEPVRVAPFELTASLAMGSGTVVSPSFQSATVDTCKFELEENLTWKSFRERCIDSDRTLRRANLDVYTARDAVSVDFNGIMLSFQRPSSRGVLKDGEQPADDDKLYGFDFTRSLTAPLAEFVASKLAVTYKAKLEALLKASLADGTPEDHPIAAYVVQVPASLSTEPQRIGDLLYMSQSGPRSWVTAVVNQVASLYRGLTPAQKAMVTHDLTDPVYLRMAFVDAVLSELSHGKTDKPDAVKRFRSTENKRWAIGFAHFINGSAPYRMTVQYSLNFGSITAVTIERGYSEADEIINAANKLTRDTLADYGYSIPSPYYDMLLSWETYGSGYPNPNPYRLGGTGIKVTGFDRQLGTLNVQLEKPGGNPVNLVVSGEPIEDRAGFFKQLWGERYEFIPANAVRLYGRETQLLLHVGEEGTIERAEQFNFKGSVTLCDGLDVVYGDYVPGLVEAYRATYGIEAYRSCDLIFNYSKNGNLLMSVASILNSTSFETVDGYAVSAAMWR